MSRLGFSFALLPVACASTAAAPSTPPAELDAAAEQSDDPFLAGDAGPASALDPDATIERPKGEPSCLLKPDVDECVDPGEREDLAQPSR